MKSLLLSAITKKAVLDYTDHPSPVLIITGEPGAGKHFLALSIASKILDIDFDKICSYPFLSKISPENNSISIETIRQLQKDLIRVVPGNNKIRQAVILDGAQKLGHEAQNALLKTLEDTKQGTVFILCMPKITDVLETIASRARELRVLPVSLSDLEKFFYNKYSQADIKQAHRLTQGKMGSIAAILAGEKTDLTDSIGEVKNVLAMTQYDRLLQINRLCKEKDSVISFLEAFSLLSHASARNTLKYGKIPEAKKWQTISKRVARAQQALKLNASPKLTLTDLFLNI